MEDLLERLEAAELLIAFATVCSKVQSRYAAQVFNYELTGRRPVGPSPLRFRMIIRLPLFPVYFRPVLRYVYANYRRRWNRVVNRIIFRWRSRQMSREHAPTLSRRRIAIDRYLEMQRHRWRWYDVNRRFALAMILNISWQLATMLNSDGRFWTKHGN